MAMMRLLDWLLIAVHVPAGALAVLLGAAAMLAPKGGPAHRRRGRAYLCMLAVLCATGGALAMTRGPGFLHLAALGGVTALLAAVGYISRRRPNPALHLLCMGLSYGVMLTAFYVDNGPKLPGWRLLPPVAFWILPMSIAAPLIALALRRHARPSRRASSTPNTGS